MFRDNKREIFGFRKYKAYGLASAVIAAFFLMSGVASADEVTKPTTSDVAALTATSPTEASANAVTSSEEVAASNSAVESAVANTAAETPIAANETSTATTANETNSNDSAVASGANTSEVTANTAAVSSDKKITATLTVPEDRTVKAASGFDDIRVLNKAREQIINLNVSGEGKLPEKSRIEIEVTTDIESNRGKVLENDLAASSSKKIIDDNNGHTYKSVIDISGLQAGLQKEMIVKPNSILADEVTIKPMHRFTTYNLYVGDELVSSKKVTETFISKSPLISTRPILNTLTVVKQSDGRVLESFTKDQQSLTISSRHVNSVYKFNLSDDKDARLVDPSGRIDYERFRDAATNTYLVKSADLNPLFNDQNQLEISVDTRATAKDEYLKSNQSRFVSTMMNITMYYSDQTISDNTDLSRLERLTAYQSIQTRIEEKISNEGVLEANLSLKDTHTTVLSTIDSNSVKATIAPPSDGQIYNDTNLPTSILKLNLDNKKLTPTSLQISFTKDPKLKYSDGEYQIEVSDADTDKKIGVASSVVHATEGDRYVAFNTIKLPSNVKSLKFKPLTNIGVGSNLSSKIKSVDYSVNFSSEIKDALSWKSEMDHSHTNMDYTRYELQLLDDSDAVQAQTAKTLSIYNATVAAKLLDNKQSFFTPDDTVRADLKMPFEIVNAPRRIIRDLYDVSIDTTVLKSAFSSKTRLFESIIRNGSVEGDGSLEKTMYPELFKDQNDRATISAFLYSDTLKSGNHIYLIPIKLKPKSELVKTADSNNVLKDGEVSALYTLVTYNEYISMTESKFKTTDSIGDEVYVENKELSALTSVANLTRSDMSHLEAMAYIPKTGLEGSTVDTTLAGKVKSVDGWDVLYTTDQISGSYKTDRNLNYVSEVDDYSKVTAVKFVSNRTVKQGDVATFDVKLDYSRDLDLKDSIRYRSVLLTENDEVLSTPIIARETKPSPTTVKELFRPDLTDALTKRLYESLMTDGALMSKTDSLGGKVLFDETSKTISNFESSTIDSLEKRSLDRKLVSVDLSDQAGLFEHHRTDHQNSSDLDSQFANYEANKELTVTNTGEQGSNATIIHYYRAAKGNIVERFVDESGAEIKSQTNSGDMIARYDYASYNHPDTIETDKATYEYSTQSGDQPYIVPEGTSTVTYVYRKVADKITYGSVIATYKDTEGNELASQENVKTNVPDGEAYTTVAKTIPSGEVVEKTPEGLTKRTTTSYELTETPSNATGNVVGNQTITVPYVYRKNVTVQTYGSVIATYKDEEGNELSSTEKVITNQPGGTYYAAASKDIQGSAHATVTPEGRRVTITTYKLIKTPDNETGDVVGGEIIEVPYIYRKNVEERMVPGDTPSVEIPATNVTRYQTEDGTDIKDSVQGFEAALPTIDNYQFTGRTDLNEAGDVQTHIYKLVETDKPNDAPKVDPIEHPTTRYVNEEGTEIKDAVDGLVPAQRMIGDTYEFTGRTETTEDGTVQTHIYKVVEHEVPGDAPKREPEEIQITLHVDEETGKELVDYTPGLASHRDDIEHYTYTGKTTQEEGIRTHFYKKVITEVPGDAPIVEVPEAHLTRYHDEDGKDVAPEENGTHDKKDIDSYQFKSTESTDSVTTHIYSKIVSEKPGDAPKLDKEELPITRHIDEDTKKELLPVEEGSNGPRKKIGEYKYTGRTDVEDGITTHYYKKVEVVSEKPGDAPVHEKPAKELTIYVDEKGKELIPEENGKKPKKDIPNYEFKITEDHDGVTVHVYTKVISEKPGDAPKLDKDELPVTRHVDENGKDLVEVEKGRHPYKSSIKDYQYSGKTTEEDGITTHVYTKIVTEKPGDAPIHEKPHKELTIYVDEKGKELIPEENGRKPKKDIPHYEFKITEEHDGITVHVYTKTVSEKPGDVPVHEKPRYDLTRYIDEDGNEVSKEEKGRKPKKNVPGYEFKITEENDGITTHIYKKVKETPTPTPAPTPTPEPKPVRETVVPKAESKELETPKSETAQTFVTDRLPDTGTAESSLAAVGLLGFVIGLVSMKRRKEDQ